MSFATGNATIEKLEDDLFLKQEVSLFVLRLDKIHPLLSGNKIFKLHFFLEEAIASSHKTILSFGGAYSNHLAATAFACKTLGLKSIGLVRGERPSFISHTLQQCIKDGMELVFVPRHEYIKKEEDSFTADILLRFGDCTIVPEGGYHSIGARGASAIYELIEKEDFSHICLATGTATTLAGILLAAKPGQQVLSFPVLKGMTDIRSRLRFLTGRNNEFENLEIIDDYHFGGYAKKTAALIDFMNDCWTKYQLPLDFVYTAKMLFGVIANIEKGTFKKGNSILCIHTGGLQGNKSLPLNTLLF